MRGGAELKVQEAWLCGSSGRSFSPKCCLADKKVLHCAFHEGNGLIFVTEVFFSPLSSSCCCYLTNEMLGKSSLPFYK